MSTTKRRKETEVGAIERDVKRGYELHCLKHGKKLPRKWNKLRIGKGEVNG